MLLWQTFFFTLPGLVAVALYGAATGSFLNVVAYRIPRGISIVTPRSRCPRCALAIRPWHNVPIVGWLFLQGRCHDCKGPISARYPVIEALTAALFVGSFLHAEDLESAVLACGIASWALALALMDVDLRVLPDSMTLPVLGIALLARFTIDEDLFFDGVTASAGVYLGLSLLAWLWRAARREEGFGVGDIRYSAALGALFGSGGVLLLVFSSAIVALGMWLISRLAGRGRDQGVPFGAALSVATIAYLLGLIPRAFP